MPLTIVGETSRNLGSRCPKNPRYLVIDGVTETAVSYKELVCKSHTLAQALLYHGFTKNSVVGVCSENVIEFPIVVLAAFYIGAIISPFNPIYKPAELAHIMSITKPSILFTTKLVCPKIIFMKRSLPFVKYILIMDYDRKIPFTMSMSKFMNRAVNAGAVKRDFEPIDLNAAEQTSFIMCSSGTSGMPKGVALSHKNIMVQMIHGFNPTILPSERQVNFGILPFFHVFGLTACLLTISRNEKIVLLKRFDPHNFLKAIQNQRANLLWIVPPILTFFAKNPLVDEYDLSSVTDVMCGAAPISKKLEETVKTRLNLTNLRQGYGLTEAALIVTLTYLGQEKFGSCGRVAPYMSVKIRDSQTGASLGPGGHGELTIKGPSIMKEYHNNPQATKETFTEDGWMLTGDVAYYDEDGYFYVVDRLKEIIFYKAYQVAPAEIEGWLLKHPKIQDAGVIGIPDDDLGEVPLAYVVKKPDENLSESEVVNFIADNLSAHKKLRGGVIFVQALPRALSGKILRRELKDMYQKSQQSKKN